MRNPGIGENLALEDFQSLSDKYTANQMPHGASTKQKKMPLFSMGKLSSKEMKQLQYLIKPNNTIHFSGIIEIYSIKMNFPRTKKPDKPSPAIPGLPTHLYIKSC